MFSTTVLTDDCGVMPCMEDGFKSQQMKQIHVRSKISLKTYYKGLMIDRDTPSLDMLKRYTLPSRSGTDGYSK
jgi:hypothetical protein